MEKLEQKYKRWVQGWRRNLREFYKTKIYGNSTIITPLYQWEREAEALSIENFYDYPDRKLSARGKMWIKERIRNTKTTYDIKTQCEGYPLFMVHLQFADKAEFTQYLQDCGEDFTKMKPFCVIQTQRITFKRNSNCSITLDRYTFGEGKTPRFISAFSFKEKFAIQNLPILMAPGRSKILEFMDDFCPQEYLQLRSQKDLTIPKRGQSPEITKEIENLWNYLVIIPNISKYSAQLQRTKRD